MTNIVIIAGNLTKDIELKTFNKKNGETSYYLSNCIAHNTTSSSSEPETSFFNFTIFGNSAKIFSEVAKKGTRVLIEGKLQCKTYTDKTNTAKITYSILANEFQLLGSPNAKKQESDKKESSYEPPFKAPSVSDEDLPF